MFIQAYFWFLNHRTILLSADEHNECVLEGSEKLQMLLDLLMQIRPNANSMEVGLIPETLDYVVIEIFSVYNSITTLLLRILRSDSCSCWKEEGCKKKGLKWINILRKAANQSMKLSYILRCAVRWGFRTQQIFPWWREFCRRT